MGIDNMETVKSILALEQAAEAARFRAVPTGERLERAAEAAFLAHWPKDDFSRFKPDDYVRQQYRAMALAVHSSLVSVDDHPLLQMGEDLRPTIIKAKR